MPETYNNSTDSAPSSSEIACPTVFIVDDDYAIRDSLRVLMRTLGLPVRTYPSAEDFLTDFQLEWTGILFVDLRMPGMGGFQLIEQLDRRGSKIPVALISGHLDEDQISESSGSYPVNILEKPFGIDRLKEILRKYFSSPTLD